MPINVVIERLSLLYHRLAGMDVTIRLQFFAVGAFELGEYAGLLNTMWHSDTPWH